MQQLREKAGLLEAPWLRTEAKSQQVWLEDISLPFLEFHWCSSRQSRVVTPYGNYPKLTQVANKCFSYYEKI